MVTPLWPSSSFFIGCFPSNLLRNFVSALKVLHSISKPLKLFCDNFIAISFSRNTRTTPCSKKIDVKLFFVKEKVAYSLILVEHTPTTSMLANPLTKYLLICVSRSRHPYGIVRSLDSLFY